MWVRSYWHFDGVRYFFSPDRQSAQTSLYAQSQWGETAFYRVREKPSPNADVIGLRTSSLPAAVILWHLAAWRPTSSRTLGFGFEHVADLAISLSSKPDVTYLSTWTAVFIPYWAIVVLVT